MINSKRLVLMSFKKLHRTRMRVFDGDEKTLLAARNKINEEYKKNKNANNAEAIEAMIKFGEDVERELRTRIIQAREVKPGVYEAKITEDTIKLDNISYNASAVVEDGSFSGTQTCQNV